MTLNRQALATIFLTFPLASAAATDAPLLWHEPTIRIVGWLETSSTNPFNRITGDFDCQGVSAGVLQWNIGKSSLIMLLKDVPEEEFKRAMPLHGEKFFKAVLTSKDSALGYVRKLQAYSDEGSCDAKLRKAKWTDDGAIFAKELGQLMGSCSAVSAQLQSISEKRRRVWKLASDWASAIRGPGATPTFAEFVHFYDTATFNGEGKWWQQSASPNNVTAFVSSHGEDGAFREVLAYLAKPESNWLQADEAKKNATLWSSYKPTRDQVLLLVQALMVSKAIGNPKATQFKGVVVSRRGSIILGSAWINGVNKKFETATAPSLPAGNAETNSGNGCTK